MKSWEEKDLRVRVEELEADNERLMKEGDTLASQNLQLLKENTRLLETISAIKKGAHDWKVRAKAAEKRCKELLEERVKRQDEHDGTLNILSGELADCDKRMLELHEELQKTRFGREELRYELDRVKAHAYDLAFGNRLDGEDE